MRPALRRLFAILAALAALATGSAAAAYPEQPVKVLMPFPPGGTVDVVARLVCNELGTLLGKPVVLDYRPGAGGVLATEAVARAQPDGYTILITTPNHTINPGLKPKLPFNTATDFVAISLVANVPELLVAHPSVPFDTLAGMLAYAKANPDKLNYSSAGSGTLPHITMELLLRSASVRVTHVPYKGAAPALSDLIAGVVQLKYDTYVTSAQLAATGKLKVLATAGTSRLPQMPNTPTVAESGFPGYEGYLWIGAIGPKGMPKEAVSTLSAGFGKAVHSAAIVDRLRRDGIEAVGSDPARFEKQIASELELWSKVIREANIKAAD